VPDRIWWDIAHAVALYSKDPVLPNVFYAAQLRAGDDVREYAEKALALRLNTTWSY